MTPHLMTLRDNAREVDLYTWLLHNRPADVKLMYGTLTLVSDHHITIKPGYHGYYNTKTGDHGDGIKLLTDYFGYRFTDAVKALTKDVAPAITGVTPSPGLTVSYIQPVDKSVIIPAPADDNGQVIRYLSRDRGIPVDIVHDLIHRGLLYQTQKGNNAAFISATKDFVELRGTAPLADKRCKHRTKCDRYDDSDYHYCSHMGTCPDYRKDPYHGLRTGRDGAFWYFIPSSNAQDVYVCEASIDAVSLYALHRAAGHPYGVYVSIGGVSKQKAIDRLIKTKNVILAVDNDAAGQECRDRNPGLDSILPHNKDWNEDLRAS